MTNANMIDAHLKGPFTMKNVCKLRRLTMTQTLASSQPL